MKTKGGWAGVLFTCACLAAGTLQCGADSGASKPIGTTEAADTTQAALSSAHQAGRAGSQATEGARIDPSQQRDRRGRSRHPRPDHAEFEHLYVGCRDATGTIQHYRISNKTGVVKLVDTALANAAVSNTALDAAEEFLYVAHTDTGRISTFSRDPVTGSLTLEGFVTVQGSPDPASNPATQTLEVDHTGRFLLAANYTANTVLVYAINADGSVGNLVASREDGLNAHQTVLNLRNEFAIVPYFGSNFIAVYRFDDRTGNLTPHVPFTTNIPAPNSGPRHLAFHPNATWLYAISETAGTVDFFSFDNRAGTLSHEETVSSLPADFTGSARSGSEIEIDRAGRFLYVSNRLDQVANGILGVFSISKRDGKLTPIQFEDSRGATPRQFSLSPDGRLLVVGNQSSDNMSVFKVDSNSGTLTYVATTPVCSVPFFARMVAP
jgi:6-phosphogluconolactonase